MRHFLRVTLGVAVTIAPLTQAPAQPLLGKTPPPVSPGAKLPPGTLDLPVIEQFRVLRPECSPADRNVGQLSYRVSNAAIVRINQIWSRDPAASSAPEDVRLVHLASGGPLLEGSGIKDPRPSDAGVAYVLVATSPKGREVSRRISYHYRPTLDFSSSPDVAKRLETGTYFYSIRVSVGGSGRLSPVVLASEYVAPPVSTHVGWGTASPSLVHLSPPPSAEIRFSRSAIGTWEDHAAARMNFVVPSTQFGCVTRAGNFALLRADRGYTDAGIPVPPPAAPPPPPPPSGTTSGCCSAGTPAGYYKTNDSWISTMCGNPSVLQYNVCYYERYSDKPVGATMSICLGQPLAPGWTQDSTSWIPTRCGHNISGTHNVATVRRTH